MDFLNKKVKVKLENAIKEHIQKLNTLLENKNELQEKYDILIKKKSNVTEELSFSKEKKIDKEEEIKELKQELSKTTNINLKKIEDVTFQLDTLMNESSNLKIKIEKLEDEKNNIEKELEDEKKKFIELERENEDYVKTIEEQKEEIKNKLKEIEILENQTKIFYETNNDIQIQQLKSSNNLLLANKEDELKLIKQQLKEKGDELVSRLELLKAMEKQVEEYTRENNEINKIIDKFEKDSDALFSKAGLNSTSKAGQYSNNQVAKNIRSNTSIYRQIDQEQFEKIDLIKQLIILIDIKTKQLVADGDKTSFDQNIRYVNDTISIINRRLESDEINLESLIDNIKKILYVCKSAQETNDQNYKKHFCAIHELFMDIYKIIDPSKKLFNQMNTGKIEKNPRIEDTSDESLSDTSQDSSMLTTVKNNELGQSALQLIADRESKLRKSEVSLKDKKINELNIILLNLNNLISTISSNKSLKQNIKHLEEIIKLLNSIDFDKNNKDFNNLYEKIVRICNTSDKTGDNEYKEQFCDIKKLVDEIS